jgi:hypothetical protein
MVAHDLESDYPYSRIMGACRGGVDGKFVVFGTPEDYRLIGSGGAYVPEGLSICDICVEQHPAGIFLLIESLWAAIWQIA